MISWGEKCMMVLLQLIPWESNLNIAEVCA